MCVSTEEVEVSPLWGQPCQLRRDIGNPEAMGKSDELELGIRPLRSIDMACSTKEKNLKKSTNGDQSGFGSSVAVLNAVLPNMKSGTRSLEIRVRAPHVQA